MSKDNKKFSRRLFILLVSKLFVFLIIIWRMSFLQIKKFSDYKMMSDKNRVSLIPIIPIRGTIYDTNNRVIAIDKLQFLLFFNKKKNTEYQKILYRLNSLLSLDKEEIEKIRKKIEKAKYNQTVMLLKNLTWKQLVLVEENSLPCFYIKSKNFRNYPYGEIVSHIVGYVKYGKIEKISKEISNLYVGSSGIEKSYNERLTGILGLKEIEVDACENYIRDIKERPSIQGENITLSINIDLQKRIYDFMPNNSAAVVVNIKDGNVLSIISKPSFDNNKIYKSEEYWQKILSNCDKPLYNKALQGKYPIGSVFKLVTFLAALKYGIKENYVVNCTGSFVVNSNFTFHCWNRYGHGHLDMTSAIKHSCNCYIYQIASMIGPKIIIETAEILGLGHTTNINLNETSGFIPNIDWKMQKFKKSWHVGDTMNLSIGQGFLMASPIQMVRLVTAVASGKIFNFNIEKNLNPEYKNLPFAQDHLEIIRMGMKKVINEISGTGYHCRLGGNKKFAGKSGTAQVVANPNNIKQEKMPLSNRAHAWFVGYSNIDDLEYAVSVLVEHGGWGGKCAAPLARDIISVAHDICS